MTDEVEVTQEVVEQPKRKKACYIGAPAIFELQLACQELDKAFDRDDKVCGIYLVGSALERPDWRDVDIRYILQDDYFAELFPDAAMQHGAAWEFDARWIIMTTSISEWLSKRTGLPIDFQFQPMTFANSRHKGHRNSMGMKVSRKDDRVVTEQVVNEDAKGYYDK